MDVPCGTEFDTTGQLQVVDHDLIAAGHPRLALSFILTLKVCPLTGTAKSDEARHDAGLSFSLVGCGASWQMAEQREASAGESGGPTSRSSIALPAIISSAASFRGKFIERRC